MRNAVGIGLPMALVLWAIGPFSSGDLARMGRVESPIGIEAGNKSARPVKLSVKVVGNRLVNGDNETITLHGVNISGTEWQCLYGHTFYAPSNEASIAAIATWHVNAVRIPLNEDCWLGINGARIASRTYHAAIREYVARLQRHGIYAILDLHWAAPGAQLSHLGEHFAGYYEMADESHAPAFWRSIAAYFRNDHAVLFDLYNEPFDISWRCWREGCTAPRGFRTAGMQQMVDAIRDVGAMQPVLVGGLQKESELGKSWLRYRPDDPAGQLVAAAHIYDQANTANFESNLGVVADAFPVVIGEAGENNCADNDFDVLLPWADAHGVSYVAWAWYRGNCSTYPALISSYSGTPTNYGLGYREHLVKIFPPPVSEARNVAAGVPGEKSR
jgi:endoglucanase